MSKSMVVCNACGQPVPAREAELVWDDPDCEADEYVCRECSEAEADVGIMDSFQSDYFDAGINDFEY